MGHTMHLKSYLDNDIALSIRPDPTKKKAVGSAMACVQNNDISDYDEVFNYFETTLMRLVAVSPCRHLHASRKLMLSKIIDNVGKYITLKIQGYGL